MESNGAKQLVELHDDTDPAQLAANDPNRTMCEGEDGDPDELAGDWADDDDPGEE